MCHALEDRSWRHCIAWGQSARCWRTPEADAERHDEFIRQEHQVLVRRGAAVVTGAAELTPITRHGEEFNERIGTMMTDQWHFNAAALVPVARSVQTWMQRARSFDREGALPAPSVDPRVATAAPTHSATPPLGGGGAVGGSAPAEHPAVVSPFDQRIEFSSVNGTDACQIFRGGYYYDRSLVDVKTVYGTTLFIKSGEDVVAPSRATDDARLDGDVALRGFGQRAAAAARQSHRPLFSALQPAHIK